MPDNKLTDNEIIKALECCKGADIDCWDCELFDSCKFTAQQIMRFALDLINRLQAQNKELAETIHNLTLEKDTLFDKTEELKAEVERLKEFVVETRRCDKEIKVKAYKECIEKVKNYIKTHCNPYGKPDFDYDTSIKILNFIDNLKKELVGEEQWAR